MKNLKTTYQKEVTNPQGVAIIMHGLNNRVDNMDAIAKEFNKLNYSTIHVALHGHRGSFEESKTTTLTDWFKDFDHAYCMASELSHKYKLPEERIVFMGYSLGSLITHIKTLKNQNKIGKFIYLAPAIKVHNYVHLANALRILPSSWALPSRNYKEYIANDSTTFSMYTALLDGLKEVDINNSLLKKRQFLLIMDKNDGLVDFEKVKKEISKREPKSFKIFPLDSSLGTLPSPSDHLILDQKTLGNKQWNEMFHSIRDFLII